MPIWEPPRAPKTGLDDRSTEAEIAGGRSWAEYSPSIPYQSSVTPTSRRFDPVAAASRASANLPTKSAFLRSTSRPSPISYGE